MSHVNNLGMSRRLLKRAGAILFTMTQVRDPAVAGSFYPSDPHELRTAIECMLGQVRPQPRPAPMVLIVPQAGHVYCWPIVATAYVQLGPHRDFYRRVVGCGWWMMLEGEKCAQAA